MVFANRRACIVRRTSWAARFALSAILACSLAVPFALTGCSSEESGGSAEERALSYVSPYDWEHNLDTSNGRFVYAENGEVKSRIGIDVSDHQRNVNWAAVAQDGIDFAMLRLGNRGSTEGQLYSTRFLPAGFRRKAWRTRLCSTKSPSRERAVPMICPPTS